jgi:hypothetical protein
METKEINSIKIKPVVHLALEPTEILGYDYFPTLYSNIYICSKRRSGKTTLIYNILKHCVSKRTNVVFFCSTWYEIELPAWTVVKIGMPRLLPTEVFGLLFWPLAVILSDGTDFNDD